MSPGSLAILPQRTVTSTSAFGIPARTRLVPLPNWSRTRPGLLVWHGGLVRTTYSPPLPLTALSSSGTQGVPRSHFTPSPLTRTRRSAWHGTELVWPSVVAPTPNSKPPPWPRAHKRADSSAPGRPRVQVLSPGEDHLLYLWLVDVESGHRSLSLRQGLHLDLCAHHSLRYVVTLCFCLACDI